MFGFRPKQVAGVLKGNRWLIVVCRDLLQVYRHGGHTFRTAILHLVGKGVLRLHLQPAFCFSKPFLSAIVDFTILRIDLRTGSDEGGMPERSNIAPHRGDTRSGTLVRGPRSLRRPSDLRGLQYSRKGVASENPHARSSVPV